MFAAGDTDSRKTSSQQFAAQIKQLEIEGSKLVAATDMLSGKCLSSRFGRFCHHVVKTILIITDKNL